MTKKCPIELIRHVTDRSVKAIRRRILRRAEVNPIERMIAQSDFYTGDMIPFPSSAVIDTTTRCNLRCLMCGRLEDSGATGDLPYEAFLRCAEALIPHLERVDLNGHGETFLNKQFTSMLAEAKKRNVSVGVTTNGTLIDRPLAESLVKLGLDEMVVSIDAASADLFEKIRKGARFEKLLENIDQVNKYKNEYQSEKPHLHVQMVAMKMNMSELPALVRLAAGRIRAESVSVIPLREYTAVTGESVLRFPDLVRNVIPQARKVADELGIELRVSPAFESLLSGHAQSGQGQAPKPGASTVYMNCEDPWKFTFVVHTGEVRPCCASSRVLGDLTKQTFPQIWHGEKYRSFRRQLLSGSPPDECLRCIHRTRVRK